jgi:hypothetical protein
VSDDEKPTQRTEKGLEIPVPKRSDFMRNLRKVATAGKPSDLGDARRPEEKRPE